MIDHQASLIFARLSDPRMEPQCPQVQQVSWPTLSIPSLSFSSVVLLTGDFVLQAVLAESHPHFNGFPDAVGLL